MAFIGIITSKKNEDALKKTLDQAIKEANLRLNVIAINEMNIDNVKNVKFDTIVMQEENNILLNRQELLKKILIQTQFLVLNSDIYNNLEIINRLKLTVITYGLNLKATVTASSIEEDKVCICVQRAIKNSKGEIVEPNEVSISGKNMDLYKIMVGYILTVLYA